MFLFRAYLILSLLAIVGLPSSLTAQVTDVDSIAVNEKDLSEPTLVRNPKKAAVYSAILPGAGQIYNRKYWKLPIVYGAMAATVYLFFDNRYWYREYKAAYVNDLNAGEPGYVPSSYAMNNVQPQSLRAAADESRQNMEYAVLGFLGIYALQIVDATVDAHLSTFDVSDDLTLDWQPTVRPGIQNKMVGGISMNLRF